MLGLRGALDRSAIAQPTVGDRSPRPPAHGLDRQGVAGTGCVRYMQKKGVFMSNRCTGPEALDVEATAARSKGLEAGANADLFVGVRGGENVGTRGRPGDGLPVAQPRAAELRGHTCEPCLPRHS